MATAGDSEQLIGDASPVKCLVQAHSLDIWNNWIFVAHDGKDGRQTSMNVGDWRNLFRYLVAVRQAAKPSHGEVPRSWAYNELGKIGGTEEIHDRCYFHILNRALSPLAGEPPATVVEAGTRV